MSRFKTVYRKMLMLGLSIAFTFTLCLLSFACYQNDTETPPSTGYNEKGSLGPNEIIDKENISAETYENTASFKRQIELLSLSWVRDPFSLEQLKIESQQTQKRSFEKRDKIYSAPDLTQKRLFDLELTGIVFFDNQYMALINNTGVKVGDNISGLKVTKIERNYIVLTDDEGEKYRMELN